MIEFHGVWLNPDDISAVYEQDEIDLACATFDPWDRILLAGSGSGLLAATIAATVQPERLICVEPNRALAQIVRENVRIDGTPLTIIDGAVGVTAGTTRLGASDSWATRRTGAAVGDEVEMYALTDLISMFNINALCLDVEGAEYELLAKPLPSITAVMIELHDAPRTVTVGFPCQMVPSRPDPVTGAGRALMHGRET